MYSFDSTIINSNLSPPPALFARVPCQLPVLSTWSFPPTDWYSPARHPAGAPGSLPRTWVLGLTLNLNLKARCCARSESAKNEKDERLEVAYTLRFWFKQRVGSSLFSGIGRRSICQNRSAVADGTIEVASHKKEEAPTLAKPARVGHPTVALVNSRGIPTLIFGVGCDLERCATRPQ